MMGLPLIRPLPYYPATIEYPHGHYKVVFDVEDRQDYKDEWTDIGDLNFYMKKRLDMVRIEQDSVTIRKFDFTYATTPVIFPDHPWRTNAYTLALQQVKEYGLNNDASMPATSFVYSDTLHLTAGDNGSGGNVIFSYETTPWSETEGTPEGKQYSTPGCKYEHDEWHVSNMIGYNGGTVSCEGSDLKINGQAYMELPARLVQPGAVYSVGVTVKTKTSYVSTAQLGLNDGVHNPDTHPGYSNGHAALQHLLSQR